MLSKGEQLIVPDSYESPEEIAKHSSSINGDVGLPGRFCTVQVEEGCFAFGCDIKTTDHSGRPTRKFMSGLLSRSLALWLYGL